MKTLIAVFAIGILLAACMPSEPSVADRQVEKMEAEMDAGTLGLHLDRSDLADVIEYMGRAPDIQERGTGERRLAKYKFSDGSALVFTFEPADSGGLALSYFRAE